ncbi:6460_t:CDS:2 [Ambispora leptoticha]|uniref:6460_t:CDS:1 n=1 Tax=Ambispora leptoticha TaxID=144679 RepID=A0A9N8VTX3_9GLOM|nr:6460_t:CDS:2 [Ambispora leptoticha]
MTKKLRSSRSYDIDFQVAAEASSASFKAIDYAFDLCSRFNIPYSLKIIYVVALNPEMNVPFLYNLDRANNLDILMDAKESANKIKEYIDRIQYNQQGHGLVSELIKDYVEKCEPNLNMLVVGSRNLEGLKKANVQKSEPTTTNTQIQQNLENFNLTSTYNKIVQRYSNCQGRDAIPDSYTKAFNNQMLAPIRNLTGLTKKEEKNGSDKISTRQKYKNMRYMKISELEPEKKFDVSSLNELLTPFRTDAKLKQDDFNPSEEGYYLINELQDSLERQQAKAAKANVIRLTPTNRSDKPKTGVVTIRKSNGTAATNRNGATTSSSTTTINSSQSTNVARITVSPTSTSTRITIPATRINNIAESNEIRNKKVCFFIY